MNKDKTFLDKYHRLLTKGTSHLIMPYFARFAGGLDHITELGVGDDNFFGTSCFVHNPKRIVQVDIRECPGNKSTKEICERSNIEYRFILGDAKTVDLEPTDFLLIDDCHDVGQCAANLKKHSPLVNSVIAVHDTNVPHIAREVVDFVRSSGEWTFLLTGYQACGFTIIGKKEYFRHERNIAGDILFTWKEVDTGEIDE